MDISILLRNHSLLKSKKEADP